MLKKYSLYLIRWQLSTPILAVVVAYFAYLGEWAAAAIANLIGGLFFFWVDRIIFRTLARDPLWEIKENETCADCGKKGTCYRVVEWLGYNRRKDKNPEYRCEVCREEKLKLIRPK